MVLHGNRKDGRKVVGNGTNAALTMRKGVHGNGFSVPDAKVIAAVQRALDEPHRRMRVMTAMMAKDYTKLGASDTVAAKALRRASDKGPLAWSELMSKVVHELPGP